MGRKSAWRLAAALALVSLAESFAPKAGADGPPVPAFTPWTPDNPLVVQVLSPAEAARRWNLGKRQQAESKKIVGIPPPPPFERPYEMWEKYKGKFGFGDPPQTQRDDSPAKLLQELAAKKEELTRKYQASKDNREKTQLREDLRETEKEIAVAGWLPRGETPEARRRSAAEQLLDSIVYLILCHDCESLPGFRCLRPQVIEDLEKIVREIGGEAAPVLWKLLSQQVRFRTADGQARKAELEQRIAELGQEFRKLTDESAKTEDKEVRRKMHDRRAEIAVEVDRLLGALVVVQSAIGGVNQKAIDKLESLLLALGGDAVPALLVGAGEQNPAATQEAAGLAMRLGVRAVPKLIEGLRNEKTFRAAARLLKQVTRQDFGDDAKAWTDWFEKTAKDAGR